MHILRMLGFFSFIMAIALCVPILIALIYSEPEMILAFLIPIAICVLIGLPLLLVIQHEPRNISVHGGFLFTTICWVYAAIIGALPFVISHSIPLFADAFFESMSGFSTTGASILTDIESLSYSILFWRSFTHWLGGMGIIVLFVSVLPRIKEGGQQLFQAEVTGLSVDKTMPTIGKSAKILWLTYCLFTVVEIVLLKIFGMTLFDACTHAFGTMATGGFSTKNTSIAFFQSDAIITIITVFMIIAGINFNIYVRVISRRSIAALRDPEFRAYIAIIVIAATIIMFQLIPHHSNASFYNRMIVSLFHVASFVTTTGYVTENFNAWPLLPQAILFLLMFCGASSGSTGGGVKVVRLLLLGKQGSREMKYILHPQGVFSSRLRGVNPERRASVKAASGFISLYMMLIALTLIVITAAGYDLTTALTTALATLGNIGPGFGKIGAVDNYAHFPDGIKYFLSVIMLCGRLELFTVIVLFVPFYWKRRT